MINIEPGNRTQAFQVVEQQLLKAAASHNCHVCGTLRQALSTIEEIQLAQHALAPTLAEVRQVLLAEKYHSMGCYVCFPSVAISVLLLAFDNNRYQPQPLERNASVPDLVAGSTVPTCITNIGATTGKNDMWDSSSSSPH